MKINKKLESFLKKAQKPLIVILGPTASGKTALSLKIAHKIGAEIISADSRQIYKGMKIGTAAILPKDQEGIIHHMLGITTPDKPISAAEYKKSALKKIKEVYKRGHIPILVGGTGLYISAIIENYDIPAVKPNKCLRNQLQKEAKEKGAESIHKKLRKLDPEAADNIHPNNIRYVIRAIEVALALTKGKNKSKTKTNEKFDIFIIGIACPREKLYERINKRVDSQIKKGLIKEVENLLKKGYKENLPAMTSLGVKEIIPYLKGRMSLEECLEILKRNTRRYAKRQLTWFRRYDNVNWLLPEKTKK